MGGSGDDDEKAAAVGTDDTSKSISSSPCFNFEFSILSCGLIDCLIIRDKRRYVYVYVYERRSEGLQYSRSVSEL
jgi:hypothetical protein